MGLREKIDHDIKQAMRNKQKDELTALRSIKSMILLALTEKGSEGISEEAGNKILMKAAKQRKESAAIYAREGREDLAQKEQFEYEVIAKYLPAQMSEEEIRKEVDLIIGDVGATGMQDMGKVMGMASKALAGKAEGKVISDIVKTALGK